MTRERHKKTRPSPGAETLPPLPPESASALEAGIAALSAALAAGQEAPEQLRELIAARPGDLAWDLHLLARLATLKHAAVPPLLAALFGAAPDKPRRKALKRALHSLQTRGVPVPADLLPREEAAVMRSRGPAPQAFASPIFGVGERYLVLEGPKEVLGGNFLVARLSDREGFRECHLLNLKSRQRSEFWEQFRSQGLGEWALVPPACAVRLLEEAYDLNPQAEGGVARYGALRGRVKEYWGSPAPPGSEELPPLTPEERRALQDQSRELALDPLFQTWLPGLEELKPWLERLKEIESSPLVLSEPQRQARIDGVVDEATGALYPPETRPAWGRRLLAMAYFLDLKGRTREARVAQAAGLDLESGERSSLMGEDPFLKALVWQALGLAREFSRQTESASGQASGLLAKPTTPLIVTR